MISQEKILMYNIQQSIKIQQDKVQTAQRVLESLEKSYSYLLDIENKNNNQLTRTADALELSKKEPLVKDTEKSLEEAFTNVKIKLDEWFGKLDGVSLGKITGYNPDDYPADHKLTDEEESKELTRSDAIDLGWDVWHNFSVEEKIEWKQIVESKQEGI